MNIYKKYTAEKYFLVNDATLSSNNPLRFRKNLLEWIYNKILTINNQNKDERYNRKAAKISALSSGKIDKYKNVLQVKKYCLLFKSK